MAFFGAAAVGVGKAIDGCQLAGDVLTLTELLASLAMSFDHIHRPEPAAVLSGAGANYATIHTAVDLPGTVAHLRAILGEEVFEEYAASGAAIDLGDAVGYARQ
jgi:hypothetical protein